MNFVHISTTPVQPYSQDRRKFPRIKAAVQVELRTEGSTVPTRVETSDISQGGFYVEMTLTLEIGTRLDVVLWVGDKKLSAKAIVATKHPQFGNGMEFVAMSEQDRGTLGCFLDSLMNPGCPGSSSRSH
jgi:c-di-GMP-binding flagellar brake protein YcgR